MFYPLNCYYRTKYALRLLPLYLYTSKRFWKCTLFHETEKSQIGILTMAFHSIEKGFVMPDFRHQFGFKILNEYLDKSIDFVKQYGTSNVQIQHIATIVQDYLQCHEKDGCELDSTILHKINSFLSFFPELPVNKDIQVSTTKESYFSQTHKDFFEFSNSRHSCRNFTNEPLSLETIKKAISLAQNSPSACNRQPSQVYIIENKETIKKVFSLHGGNRGFGHTVDKLLIITGYLGAYHINERDCVFTDCGIFTMNLAYALHYYNIGNCILNWSVANSKDRQLRKCIPIPENEMVCTLIACGNVPNQFKVCRSMKKDINEIIHCIK